MRLIALFLILFFPSWASAQKFAQGVTLADLSPIYVSINDYASGGCWTNLKEVKTYASDKIELSGGQLVNSIDEVMGKGIAFVIVVNAQRHEQLGMCYGTISVTTETFGTMPQFPDVFGLLKYSQKSVILIEANNLNQKVLDVVNKAILEWKK